jgi:hypothetical protein
VPQQSDHNPEGNKCLGTVYHPHWMTFAPFPDPSPDHHPHAIIFIHKLLLSTLTVTPIAGFSHYDLLGLLLKGPNFTLQILNFYHHVKHHNGNLTHILDSSLNHNVPTLLGGDFNTHFRLWGPCSKHLSPWPEMLENWLESQGFLLTILDDAMSCVSTTS